ncbi:hypothetical protein BV25DRAFT_799122 [Artomyces pyxidatus]|uniref:Uncharacterized protein n=1 Tax=Artomyces pyxidatus TaxID=48021 RepID=A0ACB8SY49_9AGAM|nr:hypothetical protein BV25DRAFT_799122 [Artomyces pyxidatus]
MHPRRVKLALVLLAGISTSCILFFRLRRSWMGPLDAFAVYVETVLEDAATVALRRPELRELGQPSLSGVTFQRPPSGSLLSSNPRLLAELVPDICKRLEGKTVYLVGPPSTSYQVHSFIIDALKPENATHTTFCSGPSTCPFHTLCHSIPTPSEPETFVQPSARRFTTPADVVSTNSSLFRYILSDTLFAGPSPNDPRYHLPNVDPRTGVRVSDARWTRQASKANITILSRAPIPAPAWSHDASSSNLSWLGRLRDTEATHPEPLTHLFSGILLVVRALVNDGLSDPEKVVRAALHTTISIFLPSVLATLDDLLYHREYHSILGQQLVLWHGSWYLPTSCLVTADIYGPQAMTRILAQTTASSTPWNIYHNAQVYMQDTLLAKLLPAYGISYLSFLSTSGKPTNTLSASSYHDIFGRDASCFQRAFDSPRGVLMGRVFLDTLLSSMEAWEERVDISRQAGYGQNDHHMSASR